MIAPDSSVLVAGADREHPFFDAAAAALLEVRERGRIISHTIAESYAVLTSSVYARPPATVAEYIAQFLDREPVGLSPSEYPGAVDELSAAGIDGGATYDALIALGARQAEATLISLDRRAADTYRRCRVEFELLLPP